MVLENWYRPLLGAVQWKHFSGPSSVKSLLQRFSAKIGHHEIRKGTVVRNAMNWNDVGMEDCGCCFPFS